MKMSPRVICLCLAFGFLVGGCKKQTDSAAPALSGGAAATDQTAAPANNAPAALGDAGGAPSATVEVLPGFDTATQALERNDYVSATLALVKMDTKEMSEAELSRRSQMMRQVQRSVAQGASEGNPRAIEAGNILRAASMK